MVESTYKYSLFLTGLAFSIIITLIGRVIVLRSRVGTGKFEIHDFVFTTHPVTERD